MKYIFKHAKHFLYLVHLKCRHIFLLWQVQRWHVKRKYAIIKSKTLLNVPASVNSDGRLSADHKQTQTMTFNMLFACLFKQKNHCLDLSVLKTVNLSLSSSACSSVLPAVCTMTIINASLLNIKKTTFFYWYIKYTQNSYCKWNDHR